MLFEDMGVYSNTEIKKALEDGHIVIKPFVDKNLAGSSFDVTLGHYYYRTERSREGGFYNPFDHSQVQDYFSGAQKAEVHKKWADRHGRKLFKNIPSEQPIIVLRPHERILAHTHEFIGIRPPGTSTMQARSTWGRNGLSVCLDAGWGDPGYINRWTMEIYNMNQHESMAIPVGERIAQMVFYKTGPVESEYRKLSGKYQASPEKELNEIIANWSPEQMLPRSSKDSRVKPIKIKGLKAYD